MPDQAAGPDAIEPIDKVGVAAMVDKADDADGWEAAHAVADVGTADISAAAGEGETREDESEPHDHDVPVQEERLGERDARPVGDAEDVRVVAMREGLPRDATPAFHSCGVF